MGWIILIVAAAAAWYWRDKWKKLWNSFVHDDE